jgi:HEAT repeat protein
MTPAGTGGTWPLSISAHAGDLLALEQQLTSALPNQRAEAIETLVDLQGPDAAPAVVQSLGDHDENVRYRALQKAHGAGLALPPEVLTELVQHDSSALVRMLAGGHRHSPVY